TVAPAIRAADPSAKVVYAGLNRNDYGFVEAGYRAVPNMGDYFDVMAVHPYVDNGRPPEEVRVDSNGRINPGSFAGYREVRQTMLNHGDDKPIWLTEFGWSTTSQSRGVSPQTQADYLVRAYRCLEQDPYVQVATWYSLRNEFFASDADTWAAQLGLMSTDFTHKPAFDALKNYRPGTGTCTYDYLAPSVAPPVTKLLPSAPAAPPLPAPEPQRKSPRLAVQRALIRDGKLVLDARVARGATGSVRGTIAYQGIKHAFVARPDADGKIRMRELLPDGADAWAGWVALVYGRDADFQRQWVILQASRRSPKLRLGGDARTTAVGRIRSIAGTVADEAKGAVIFGLTYRMPNGSGHVVTRRRKIRDGKFGCAFRLPVDARDALVYVVFPGDAARGISGGSRVVPLG
ncbi:MAG: glycosyl hydrolase, partial [Gaiellaceae bacterium]